MPPVFRPVGEIVTYLETKFPNLKSAEWRIKSPFDGSYNCIAWAAGDSKRWWDPTPSMYWPPNIDREVDVQAFVQVFATMGYQPCDDASFRFGYQKVAVYADDDMAVTHMARQHLFGRGWLSKLGECEDILHRKLGDIEGDTTPTSMGYGTVVQILKRSWWAALKFWFYRMAQNCAIR